VSARRRAARWAAASLAVHLLVAGAILVRYPDEPEWFVHFGKSGVALDLAHRVLGPGVLVPNADGHDGRAFWVLARDPLLVHARQDAKSIDRPVYRAQRIGYPLLAAPWHLGGEYALVWGLLVTNLVAIAFGGYLAALLALDVGAPARAGLAFALCPGVVAAVLLDASDAVALAALLAAMLALRRGWTGRALIAAGMAVLAKEPTILPLVGLALFAPGLRRHDRVAVVAVPTAVATAWGLYERWRFDWAPTRVQELGRPFWGYVDAYRRGWRPSGNWVDAAVALALLPFTAFVVWRWWRARSFVMAAALPPVLLVPFLSAQVIDLTLNSVRTVVPTVTLLAIDLYAAAYRSRPTPPPPAPEGAPATRR